MSVTIVLPVKDPCQAKSRLAPLLSESERSRLALAMFSDTARALEGPELPVVVVTGSGMIARLAARRGWRVLWDAEQQSESGSVDLASGRLASEGVRSVLRLPADIPLVQPRDVRTLAESLEGPGSTVLTPSRDRWGTNAILRSPPGLYPSSFGHDSFRRHLASARAAGAVIHVIENANIAHDLDRPADLLMFIERKSDTETRHLLMEWDIGERLVHYAATEHPDPGPARNS